MSSQHPVAPHLRGQTPESLAALWPDLALPPGTARRVLHSLVQADSDDLAVRGLSRVNRRALLERGRLPSVAEAGP